jgi:2-desacetyl-2-hydroxyethyl bacteriochlorophyllide A dehydrogenase
MRAIVFKSVGEAAVEDIPEPRVGPADVLVEVAATGVCHTDIDILHGRYLAAYPVVPGHEVAGTVVAKGAQASTVEIGARVAVDPLIVCGRCAACIAGRPSLCETLQAYGATTNGGFAARVAVDARNVHPIGDLPFHVAALAEPFACVMHGVDRAGRVEGREALVLGAGPIGLMMMMALGARGAGRVTMTDVEPSRLQQAKSLGADEALHGDALDPGRRFDLVVDCTGVPAVCERMPSLTKDGGTLLYFGVCPPAARIGLSPYEVFRRELTLIGSHSLSNNIPDALGVLSRLGARAEALVSHRLSLGEIAERLRAPVKTGSMKIQFAAA